MMELVPLEEKEDTRAPTPLLCVKIQPESSHLLTKRRPSPDMKCASILILDFSTSTTVRNKHLLFKVFC